MPSLQHAGLLHSHILPENARTLLEALRISRHNAACQLIHADIRKIAKGGGALHSAPDLVWVMTDTGKQPMTSEESLESLYSITEDNNPLPNRETPHHD